MMVLVSYDVTKDGDSAKRLCRVARTCRNYGQRVQYSVFECLVDPAQWTALRLQLEREIDLNVDSLRYYFLGANWRKRVQHVGAKPSMDPEGSIIA